MALQEMELSAAIPFSCYEHFFETYLGIATNEITEDSLLSSRILMNLNSIVRKKQYRPVLQLLQDTPSTLVMLEDLSSNLEAAGNIAIQRELVSLFWRLGKAQQKVKNYKIPKLDNILHSFPALQKMSFADLLDGSKLNRQNVRQYCQAMDGPSKRLLAHDISELRLSIMDSNEILLTPEVFIFCCG